MREDIASYLRSVGSLYPGGIPRSMIGNRVAAPSAKPAAKEKRVAFLWLDPTFSDSASPLADAAGQLLQAAIEKGLKLPLSDALVVRTSNPDVLHAALNSPAAGVFVVLGDKTAAAALGERRVEVGTCIPLTSGSQILTTLDLEDILSDQGRKRVFWSHLQTILTQL